MLTQKQLKELLAYDPETGVFTWRVYRASRAQVGQRAGHENKRSGRREISIDYYHYLEHQLAWFYMIGEWPQALMDHKNGNPFDNRWVNLRLATHTQNMANRKLDVRNTSGIKGVSWNKANRCWVAMLSGKYLGQFSSKEDAKQARNQAAGKQFGEFAREL